MIQLKNIDRSYKLGAGQLWVLRRIQMDIQPGEFITIMGPSGSGKSSLLNILGLLDDDWQGEYWFGEQPVHKLNRKQRADLSRRSIGMVFQSYHLLDDLTVAENIDLPLSYKNIPTAERQGMVADVLDRFRMVAKKDLFPSQLSGGQQQLVGIARAVIHKPALLLADEPTGNLHSVQAKEIMELFRELNQEGTTIVQVTHSDLNATYGTRTVQLSDGWMLSDSKHPRVTADRRRKSLMNPMTSRTRALLDCICIDRSIRNCDSCICATSRTGGHRFANNVGCAGGSCGPGDSPNGDAPSLAQQIQSAQQPSFAPQEPFQVSLPHSHKLFSQYRPTDAPPLDLTNSPRLQSLIRDGKLYISLSDTIALAIENNLDLAYFRYNFPIAETDYARTKAGAPANGVDTGIVQSSTEGGFSSQNTGGGGASSGSAAAGAGGIVTSTLGAGTSVSSFDPFLKFQGFVDHNVTQEGNQFQ